MTKIPSPPLGIGGDQAKQPQADSNLSEDASPQKLLHEYLSVVHLEDKKLDTQNKKLGLVLSCESTGKNFTLNLCADYRGSYTSRIGGLDFLNDVQVGQRLMIGIFLVAKKQPILVHARVIPEGCLAATKIRFLRPKDDLYTVLKPQNPKGRFPNWTYGFRDYVNLYEACGILPEWASEAPWDRFRPYGQIFIAEFLAPAHQTYTEDEPPAGLQDTIKGLGLDGLTGFMFEEIRNDWPLYVGVWLLTDQRPKPLLTPNDISFFRQSEAIKEAFTPPTNPFAPKNAPVRPIQSGEKYEPDKPDVK